MPPSPERRAARRLLAIAAALAGAATGTAATLVGDEACAACHGDRVHSFHGTAHAMTSSLPSADTVHGSFAAGSNILMTVNPDLMFIMEARDDGFYQTAHRKTSASEELSRSERIGIVVGSGRKGQTYLYWDGSQLFQLPVSFWTDIGAWVNSPGYIDGAADFDRPIVPRCLECHASSFDSEAPPENRYRPGSLVLGISCERCHGPGSEHVSRMPKAPASPDSGIVNPAKLSRGRQLQLCALCHNGAGDSLVAPGTYVAGEDIGQFIAFARWDPKVRVDVHARQVPLLEASRCFRFSKTMTCTTCHDVHQPQRDAASFAPKCLTCHQVASCKVFPKLGASITSRCIDCHMPLQETGKIVSRVDGTVIRPMVRNHRIAIYPDTPPQ